MNIENLLNEINDEKEKIKETIKIDKDYILNQCRKNDMGFLLLPSLILSFSLFMNIAITNDNNPLYLITAFLFFLLPFLSSLINSFFKINISFSYYLNFLFKREKIDNLITTTKEELALEKQTDHNFLRRVSLHMTPEELKLFLTICDGNISINKLNDFVGSSTNISKVKKIENLTTVIYKENKLTHNFLKGEKNEYKRNI